MPTRKLEASLCDPESMTIRNDHIPTGTGYLCGEVNVKKGFGGVTGYQRFIAGAASSMPVVVDGEGISTIEFAKLWAKAC